jgi:hypothetical protein
MKAGCCTDGDRPTAGITRSVLSNSPRLLFKRLPKLHTPSRLITYSWSQMLRQRMHTCITKNLQIRKWMSVTLSLLQLKLSHISLIKILKYPTQLSVFEYFFNFPLLVWRGSRGHLCCLINGSEILGNLKSSVDHSFHVSFSFYSLFWNPWHMTGGF